MSDIEKQLILRLKTNDSKAFDELFLNYYGKVFNMALRFLNTKEDAEEIVQNTFIAVWENRNEIDENRSFPAYLMGIARNIVFNVVKRKLYKSRFVDHYLRTANTLDYSTEETILFQELKSAIENAWEELPPKRKTIFYLSRKEGLSYKEIAERLNITESTVNTQLSKALDFFRDKLMEV